MNVCIRQKLPDETGLLFDWKGVDTKMAEIKSVFISYSSKNKELVHKIVRVLEHIGVSYWKAPDMIPVGSNYAREIPRAIRECDLFLLILSKESQESVWVEKEVDSAICCKKNIVPFKIDDTPMNDTFSFYFNNVQMIPYYLGEVAAVKSLCEQLQPYTTGGTSGEGIQAFMDQTKSVEAAAGKQSQTADSGRTNDRMVSSKPKFRPLKNNTGQFGSLARYSEEDVPGEIYTVGTRMSAEGLSLNRIPMDCKYCGEGVEKIARGVYRCKVCGRENYDYFQTVRLYLERFGATPALIIERETGVPRKAIEQFLRQEYLEIPRQSPIRMSCENCGAPIRTGYLCDQCKKLKGFSVNYGQSGNWRSSR